MLDPYYEALMEGVYEAVEEDNTEQIQESVVKIFSCQWFHNHYKSMSLWYITDCWYTKLGLWKRAIDEQERAKTWQAMMGLRRLLKDRSMWDAIHQRPVDQSIIYRSASWID